VSDAGEPAPSLEAQSVRKVYGSGSQAVEALRGVSFVARPGELIALVGPSGSGKSTLLAIVGALLVPTSGSIVVGGVDIASMSSRQRTRYRRDGVGFVFQSSNLVPYLTARENVALSAEFGGDRSAIRRRAGELIEELGLSDAADTLATKLSGGQRQRVAIARALVRDAPLLLVDEPTASLDTARGTQVVEALRDEVHARGKIGLMVTHDLEMAARGDRILEIRDGQLREHSPDDIPNVAPG
jgi:putative ABC transport system ATP-binding protein